VARLLKREQVAVRAFQEGLLNTLSLEPYEVLAERPSRERVMVPAELSGLKAFICATRVEQGGIQISVELYEPFWLVLSDAEVRGFEMLPDGTVLPFDTEHDPDD